MVRDVPWCVARTSWRWLWRVPCHSCWQVIVSCVLWLDEWLEAEPEWDLSYASIMTVGRSDVPAMCWFHSERVNNDCRTFGRMCAVLVILMELLADGLTVREMQICAALFKIISQFQSTKGWQYNNTPQYDHYFCPAGSRHWDLSDSLNPLKNLLVSLWDWCWAGTGFLLIKACHG